MTWYGQFSPTGNFVPNAGATPGIAPQWDQPVQPNAPPPDAFTWGANGQRVTPDQIAQKDKVAQALMASGMDYSPVQSWTQGAARLAQGILGGVEERQLDKDRTANTRAEQAIIANLASGGAGGSNAALAAMTSPYVSDGTREAAKLVYQSANRKPLEPHYWETNNGSLFKVGDDGQPVPVYNDPSPKMNFIPDGMGGGQWLAVPAGPAVVSDPVKPVGKITPRTTGGPKPSASGTFPLR